MRNCLRPTRQYSSKSCEGSRLDGDNRRGGALVPTRITSKLKFRHDDNAVMPACHSSCSPLRALSCLSFALMRLCPILHPHTSYQSGIKRGNSPFIAQDQAAGHPAHLALLTGPSGGAQTIRRDRLTRKSKNGTGQMYNVGPHTGVVTGLMTNLRRGDIPVK